MVSTRSQGQNDDNVDVDVANSNELDALNLAHGQTSNDSIANMQVAQNDNEISRLLSLQQLSLDDIHCSLDFVNNCIDANESTDMCREFFVETEQKVDEFESLTKEIILLANTHLHSQSERLAEVKNDLRTIRLKVMKKRSSDQLCKTARPTVNDTTSNERIVTSNNPLPAFTTVDLSSESNIPGISSTTAGTNGTLFREATVDQSHFAPYFPQGVGTSQRMSSTFQKSIPKVTPTVFNGDPLLWLDWIGLFNATIHSSDMTTAEKMTHLQTLVKDQAKSTIRGYGYNGDMYFIALKRLQDTFGNPTKIITSILQRLSSHPSPSLRQLDSFTAYSNFLTTLVDTFEQLNFQHDICSTTNVQRALAKLPTETRLAWNRHAVSSGLQRPTLKDITSWLQEFALACSEIPVAKHLAPSEHSTAKFFRPSSSTSSALHQPFANDKTHSAPSTDKVKKNFCPESKGCDLLRQCPHFKSLNVQNRYEHVKKLKLCFNCLGPHAFKDCKSETTCRIEGCHRRHHTLLHRDQQPAVTSTVNTRRHQPGIVPIVPVTFSYGNNRLSTYALLDSGSSVTLLAESAAKQLKPNLQGNQPLSVSGINTVAEIQVATL